MGEKIFGYQLHAVKSLRLEIIFVTYTSAEPEEISGRVHAVPAALDTGAAHGCETLLEYSNCTQTSITALITYVEPRQYSSEQMLSFWKSC